MRPPFSPMHMAQYISRIANGGYQIQPHLVKEFREPSMDQNEIGPGWQAIQPTMKSEEGSWILILN